MSIHIQKQQVVESRKWQAVNQGYSFLNKLPRSVGIEYDHHVDQGFSKVKPFDKLPKLIEFGRDDHPELRTIPARGDALITSLLIVKEIAKRSRPECYKNWGLHVHVDALDLTTPELIRFVYIYQYIEATIQKYVIHPSRKIGRFAPRLIPLPGSSELTKTGLVAFCDKNQTGDMLCYVFSRGHLYEQYIDFNNLNLPYDTYNYKTYWWPQQLERFSIALSQLGAHGTIEFRSKEAVAGTDPVEDIVYWPLFCGWLIESVKRVSDYEIVKILDPAQSETDKKETNSINFLDKFIPQSIVQWFTNHAYASM